MEDKPRCTICDRLITAEDYEHGDAPDLCKKCSIEGLFCGATPEERSEFINLGFTPPDGG